MSERLGEPQAIAAEVHADKPSHPSQVGQSPSPGGELAALLARVEGATGPNFELEWNLHLTLLGIEGAGAYGAHPNYTASLDAALALVERVSPHQAPAVRQDPRKEFEGLWHAYLAQRGNHTKQSAAWGSTAPLALLAALLRSLVPEGGDLGLVGSKLPSRDAAPDREPAGGAE